MTFFLIFVNLLNTLNKNDYDPSYRKDVILIDTMTFVFRTDDEITVVIKKVMMQQRKVEMTKIVRHIW
jgi:archaellum biogenesis ATPase FlaH